MDTYEAIRSVGFPIVIALILLWDKIKTNGSLRRAVDNNTAAIESIWKYLNTLEDKLFNVR